jgi:hypothetical protein
MEIITGYTGENHVTSADDASLYRGILGSGDYVLDVGNKFAATIIDNNTVRISDGDLVIQGHQARIRANDYEEVTIDNGTPGQKRNDLIVARYQKNTTTGIESITLEVVKGTPGETATDPDIIQEDLSTGGTQRDFALYRVSLNGLAIESVTSLFTVIPNLKDFMTHQAEFANTPEIITNENGTAFKYPSGALVCWHTRDVQYADLTAGEHTIAWTFPVPFLEGSRYFLSYQLGVANLTDAEKIKVQTVTRSMSRAHDSATCRLILSGNLGSAASHEFLAIGRWK